MIARCRATFIILLLLAAPAVAQEASIRIDAAQVTGNVGRYLAGACIEDVNHEIYGGLYSQMVFGESFQEPSGQSPVKAFQVYGGQWSVADGELRGGAGDGPKLISDQPAFADGEVGVELNFADRKPGNAGLIVKVGHPATGADSFEGYEVSLDPQRGMLVLGRHRRNWELIKEAACDVPTDHWISLRVKLMNDNLEVLVGGKTIVTYEDREHPLPTGAIGLRQWRREVRYRDFWIASDGRTTKLPFERNDAALQQVSGMWAPLQRGTAAGRFTLESDCPFLGKQSQKIVFATGQGEVGIENRSLNRQGMCFRSDKTYEGFLWARAQSPTDLWVALENQSGTAVLAETKLRFAGNNWQRLDFKLRPTADDESGRLALILKQPGEITIGHAFLQPGPWGRFKELPVRRDVVEGMIAQNLSVVRYGGSMVNHGEYRWKNMIGSRDRRPPTAGTWYRYSTSGWGILDFLNLCEAASWLGIPAFNMGERPEDMADFIDYVNSASSTAWGRKRDADGHPQPYRLRYLELGNEERIDENYAERFRALAEAIWHRDPDLVLVVGDFLYSKPITDAEHLSGAASGITSMAGHRQILRLAKQHGREVWFDVHIDTDGPGASDSLRALPSYVDALDRIADGARHKVVVFELNSGNHAVRRALGNAVALNTIARIGERIAVVCSANGLQVDRQNDNGWDQGLLFMNPCKVWPQPPYFVTQQFAQPLPQCVKAEVQSPGNVLDVTVTRREGVGSAARLQIQAVNIGARALEARLEVYGFKPGKTVARVIELSGPLNAVNSASEPQRIAPRVKEWRYDLTTKECRYTFPAHSVTLIQLE